MDRDDLEEYMLSMQADFLAGRLDVLASKFSMPLVVYSVAGVTVMRTKEELMQRTAQYRAAVLSMSVATSDAKVISCDPVLNNRLRATVRVTDFDADGRVVIGSLIRYFLILKNESYEIEMMEYLEAPFPPEEVEKLVN